MNVNKRCGCYVERDAATGVLHAISKCQQHQDMLRQEMASEEAHYQRLGAMDHPEVYVREFKECFGPLTPRPSPLGENSALEIGAGTSPYIDMIRKASYSYAALETSPFAVEWLRQHAGIAVIRRNWEDGGSGLTYSLILAAHCIEHMKHAPNAIKTMANELAPLGRLYIIVPDDEDLCNPDHWWFFTPATLCQAVEAAGLQVQQLSVKRRVKREQFIYCQAIKPDK